MRNLNWKGFGEISIEEIDKRDNDLELEINNSHFGLNNNFSFFRNEHAISRYTTIDPSIKRYALESGFISNAASIFINSAPKLKEFFNTKLQLIGHLLAENNSEGLLKIYKSAIKKANSLGYLNLMPLLISQPESFKGAFLDYSSDLIYISTKIRESRIELFPFYHTMLSTLVTNKGESISVKDNSSIFKKLEKDNLHIVSTLKPYFPKSTNISKTNFKSVIGRLSDLTPLFENATKLQAVQTKNELEKIKDEVKAFSDLLDMFVDSAKSNKLNISPETAKDISTGAREVGRHVELTAMVYFDTLVFTNSIMRLAETIINI
jgi:hypothetical protein